jgi:hypothetical protein
MENKNVKLLLRKLIIHKFTDDELKLVKEKYQEREKYVINDKTKKKKKCNENDECDGNDKCDGTIYGAPLSYGVPCASGKISDEIYLSKKYIHKIEYCKCEKKIYYLSSKYKDVIQIPHNIYVSHITEKATNLLLYDDNRFITMYSGNVWYEVMSMSQYFMNDEYMYDGICDDEDIKEKYSHCELIDI